MRPLWLPPDFTHRFHCAPILETGATNRAVAATGLNLGSSRSHSVFTITVTQKDINTSATKSGKLVLVDLAGSEMVRKSNATGQQLEEAKMINKSLSALGGVINALTDDKQSHIPYRDSKLTRILQDSLGGNSKTALIIAVSPSSYNSAETVSTLRFGTRAKSIENKVTINQTRSVEELEALLVRAEKAIDAQAAHIITLSTQLQAAYAQLSAQVRIGLILLVCCGCRLSVGRALPSLRMESRCCGVLLILASCGDCV